MVSGRFGQGCSRRAAYCQQLCQELFVNRPQWSGRIDFARPVAGFVQLTGSALYAIAVSHADDGTLRPMTTAVATAGLAAFVTFAWLLRRRVVLENTERRPA